MPTSLIAAMDLQDCAPGVVHDDDYDPVAERDYAIYQAEDKFKYIARALFDQRDELEGHIKCLEKHGIDTASMTRLKNILEHLGALLAKGSIPAVNAKSDHLADIEGSCFYL